MLNKKDDLKNKPRKIKRVKKKKLIFSLIFIAFFLIFFGGLGGIAGYVLSIINSSPDINSLMVAPKGYTTIIYDGKKGDEVYRLHGDQNRVYVTLDKIPQYLQDAVVVMEDERFYQHNGIDLKGLARAFWANVTSLSLSEGASTITQQLIKNNMLTNDKKIERKLREQYLALELEKIMNKSEILELYLNTIPLGNRNVYGVQTAANRYFNKDVSELNLSEATVIAAITQNGYYDPIRYPENNKKRRQIILDKLLKKEKISKEDYDAVLEDDVYSRISIYDQEYKNTHSYTSYFVDEVIREVKADLMKEKGLNESQAINLIYSGGLSIYSTVDPSIQNIMEEEYLNEKNFPTAGAKYELVYNITLRDKKTKAEKHYEKRAILTNKNVDKSIENFKSELITDDFEIAKDSYYLVPQPQSAMVVMDHATGQVKGIVGGRGEKNMSQDLNRATQSLRQPGSTFKVLASFAPAMDMGKYTLASVVDDIPYQLGKEYQYKEYRNWYNSQDYAYRGLSTIREGIRDSMNIVAVKTVVDIGLNTSFNYLKLFGFTSVIDKEVINGKTFSDKTPGIALGGLTKGVSLLELNAGYASIANNGVYIEPTFYTKVLDHDGNILLEKHQAKHKVLKPSTAFLLTDAMKDVITSGTGTGAKFKSISMPVAGKSGTTSDNKDILFTGYTPYYTASIWAGYDKSEVLKSGATSFHKTLWGKVMERIHAKLPKKDFQKPSNIVVRSICTESGKLAVPGLCNQDPRGSTVRDEYFTSGTEPKDYCDVHVEVDINSANGKLATNDTPKELIVRKIYIKRPSSSVYPSSAKSKIKDAKYEVSNLEPDIPVILPPFSPENQTDVQQSPLEDEELVPTHQIETTAVEE